MREALVPKNDAQSPGWIMGTLEYPGSKEMIEASRAYAETRLARSLEIL
jgi:hypothetical protein